VDRPLREVFDAVAERYGRVRPGYPDELFDELAALAGLTARDRVLEIGPGTGQATVPLARRGYRVVAVELGPRLAAVARRNLAAFPDAEVVDAAFEDWPLPADPFHAVVAATAFHWLDRKTGLARAAAALAPEGALAVIRTAHVAGGDEALFDAIQDCYVRLMPGTPADGERLRPAADVPTGGAELEAGGRFAVTAVRRYERDIPYTTAEYRELLCTYSGHLELPPARRVALLDCIGALIDAHGGRIVKRYLFELLVARPRRA
jgi:SAM-dependent methyltransferase